MTKGERREASRFKRRHGMRLDNAGVRRIQIALLTRSVNGCKVVPTKPKGANL